MERHQYNATTCHVDCGCDAGASCCLNCPLTECIYDGATPAESAQRKRAATLADVVRLQKLGLAPRDIGLAIHRGERTVFRYLTRHVTVNKHHKEGDPQ